ncbi:MAG: (Fe-S)-binding protein [Negativicutes bacterium]|nr:(Fe-S)-binding protein [Negativicutes bacterium]
MKSTGKRDRLQDVHDIVSQCDRCGTCLPVCPLFGVKDVEAASARGKNNIARALAQGGLDATPDVLAAVNFCLLCRACVDTCPSKVKTDEAMMAVRQYFADATGGAGIKYKALGSVLKNRTMVKLASGALKVMKRVGINRLAPYGMAPSEFTREEYLARFAGPAALGAAAPASPATLSDNTKVAYFYGCGMKMMFPEAAKQTVAILSTLTEPKLVDNVCCGLPHLAHGQKEDFLALAKENIRLYAEADVVVSECASCSSMLKHTAQYLAGDPEWADRANAFSRKVMGFTEYLVKAGYKPRQKVDATITFHEPCHLGRGQGIKKQPRELLQAASNYVEMPGADTCCGGAGTFHMDYPEIAGVVLDKKRQNIEKTGAAIVVTECPVCLVQMAKAAEKSGKFRAMHISQVL